MTSAPDTQEQHGADAIGNIVYTVAGIRAAELTDVYGYDTVAGTWATLLPLPIAVQSPVVRAVNGKLYCIGGLKASAPGAGVYPDTYEYDPGANTWTKKADMPTAREDMGSAVVGSKIYVFGGLGPQSTPTKKLEIYDTVTNQWTAGADMPDYKHLGDFGASINGLVYAIGSTNTFVDYPTLHVTTDCYVYNPSTDQWAAIASIPVSTCYKEVISFRGKLYVVSGCTSNTTTYTNVIYAYDPGADSWALAGAISPIAARGTALAAVGDRIYITGGFTGAAVKTAFALL